MPRVTLIGGVRGVGKTSLVSCVLQASDGLRIGVLTDNIAALLDAVDGATKPPYPNTSERVDLSNGCVCVKPINDVVAAIIGMLSDPEPFDYIVAEDVGDLADVVERMASSETVCASGEALWTVSPVDTIVTVIDCEAFPRTMRSHDTFEPMSATTIKAISDDINISEVLMEQTEIANVLILNKTDLVQARYLDELSTFLSFLNPAAQQYRTQYGAAALDAILGTRLLKSPDTLAYQAGWAQATKRKFFGLHNSFKITVFVFRARRPFHPRRLHDLLERTRQGLTVLKHALRSKGYAWLATRNDRYGNWSHAGREFHLDSGGPWFASIPEAFWPTDPASRKEIESDFCEDESIADRRQEIAFIGKKMDQLGLEEALSNCLLSDAEYALGPEKWEDFEDPFSEWPVEELDDTIETPRALDLDVVDRMLGLRVVDV